MKILVGVYVSCFEELGKNQVQFKASTFKKDYDSLLESIEKLSQGSTLSFISGADLLPFGTINLKSETVHNMYNGWVVKDCSLKYTGYRLSAKSPYGPEGDKRSVIDTDFDVASSRFCYSFRYS
jgi:hypothetical protein